MPWRPSLWSGDTPSARGAEGIAAHCERRGHTENALDLQPSHRSKAVHDFPHLEGVQRLYQNTVRRRDTKLRGSLLNLSAVPSGPRATVTSDCSFPSPLAQPSPRAAVGGWCSTCSDAVRLSPESGPVSPPRTSLPPPQARGHHSRPLH